MKLTFMAVALALLLTLTACASVQDQDSTERLRCKRDADCVCGGTDRLTGKCFIGNRDYYDQFVDKSKDCPDFCGGIGGDLETHCIEGMCKQAQRTVASEAECSTDADCMTGGCSGQVCAPKEKAAGMITTCEWTAEYGCLKTHANCGCNNGKCGWNKASNFDDCVAQQENELGSAPIV